MIASLLLLLILQWLGEVTARLVDLSVPGPVLGMAFLTAGLAFRSEIPPELDRVARGLLDHLSLLFVPAGVGVVVHVEKLRGAAIPLAAALLLGTLVTVLVTGLILQWLAPAEEASS